VLADADGVIVIPARVAEKVLEQAERLTAKEILIRRDLGKGASLEDVLKRYGRV
jgi:regulator of RNase E activity RraA